LQQYYLNTYRPRSINLQDRKQDRDLNLQDREQDRDLNLQDREQDRDLNLQDIEQGRDLQDRKQDRDLQDRKQDRDLNLQIDYEYPVLGKISLQRDFRSKSGLKMILKSNHSVTHPRSYFKSKSKWFNDFKSLK
jgi:hypothetical protein